MEASCWSMLLEICTVYGPVTGPSIVETELLFVLIESISWASSWMNRGSYCSHAVVSLQEQIAQLGYIFYFSDQKQWSTKHSNDLRPFSLKIYPHLNNRSEKTIFKKFCFIFSGWKIEQILTHLQLSWMPCDLSLAFGRIDVPQNLHILWH